MSTRDTDALIGRLHGAIALQPHLNALFAGRAIGSMDFLNLAEHCRQVTGTPIPGWKAIRRVERLWNLLRYALYALATTGDGGIVECGVFRGFSALALSHVLRPQLVRTDARPREIWLADSFEGLSEPQADDAIASGTEGQSRLAPASPKGTFATPLEFVQERLREFPFVRFAKGWIPVVFEQLPAGGWAFVHIDVDLYRPTLDALGYFYPRLVPGAVVVNDDFGSPMYPGAGKAWAEFFAARDKGYAILDSGQAVYIHSS